MKIIGLTGNSGSGKTTISKILRKYGAYIIDADEINHKLMEPSGKSYVEIKEYFGENILKIDATINRITLGQIVFKDPVKRLKLEKICHKHVVDETLKKIDFLKNSNEYKYIVIDAPLLLEANMQKIVDVVWLIYADENIRLKRILARDGLGKDKVLARFRSQTLFEKQKEMADVIIKNNDLSLENLEKEVVKNLSI